MPLNEEELKDLGAAIINADKDKFGLQTDGQGNVVIPEGGFVNKALSLDKKYFVFGDCKHGATFGIEQIYTPTNVAAMRAHGIKRVFDECNEGEFKIIKEFSKLPLAKVEKFDMRPYTEGYRILQAANILYVPSDPRTKYKCFNPTLVLNQDDKDTMRDIADEAKVLGWVNQFIHETQGLQGQAFIDAVQKFHQAHLKEQNLIEFTHKVARYYLKDPNDIAQQDRAFRILSGDVTDINLTTAADDVANFSYNLLNGWANYQWSMLEDTANWNFPGQVAQEAHRTEPIFLKKVRDEAAMDSKTVLRWGIGHFIDRYITDNQDQVDAILGQQNCLIIGTVFDENEMQSMLNRISHYEFDAPDYLYMPERKAADGKIIPEKVVSVAEYLDAQQKKQQAPAQQPSNSRG